MDDDREGRFRAVQRSYFAMVPLRQIATLLQDALAIWTDEEYKKEVAENDSFNGFTMQEKIVRLTVLNEKHFQPPLNYRRKFLRLFVETVEDRKWEVLEDVWMASSQFCQEDSNAAPPAGYQTFFLDSDVGSTTVSIAHQPCLISNGTTGLSTWDAAFYLVEWLSLQPELVRGRRVLELGAGSGLCGMCICRLFSPHQYVFTDHHRDVLAGIQKNLQLNEIEENLFVKIFSLDWTTATENDVAQWSPDVVLASDIIYDPDLFRPFFRTLDLLSGRFSRSVKIFVSVKRRAEETFQNFQTIAETLEWRLEDVSDAAAIGRIFPPGSYSSDGCHLFAISKPPPTTTVSD